MPYRRLSMSRSYPLLSSSRPFYMHSAHYTYSLVLKARLGHVAVRLATETDIILPTQDSLVAIRKCGKRFHRKSHGFNSIPLPEKQTCTHLVRSGQGQVAGTFEYGNESSGSMKCGEFLDQLRTGQLLKKDSAPWSKQVSKYTLCWMTCCVCTESKRVLECDPASLGQTST